VDESSMTVTAPAGVTQRTLLEFLDAYRWGLKEGLFNSTAPTASALSLVSSATSKHGTRVVLHKVETCHSEP
jgi:hypothetical protein